MSPSLENQVIRSPEKGSPGLIRGSPGTIGIRANIRLLKELHAARVCVYEIFISFLGFSV